MDPVCSGTCIGTFCKLILLIIAIPFFWIFGGGDEPDSKILEKRDFLPVPTKHFQCGLKNYYKNGQTNLYDPKDPTRFINPMSSKIINGQQARHGEFPWQVALKSKYKHHKGKTFCGGTLINSWTVLTAAHCIVDTTYIKDGKFILGFGWHRSKGLSGSIENKNKKFDQQVINIDMENEVGEVHIHPEYKQGRTSIDLPETRTLYQDDRDWDGANNNHDIAIIILPTEVKISDNADAGILYAKNRRFRYKKFRPQNSKRIKTPVRHQRNQQRNQEGTFVRPVCLPEESVRSRREVLWISGWGNIDNHGTGSEKLMYANITSMSNNECHKEFMYKSETYKTNKLNMNIVENQICANGTNSENISDTCRGDSGGPAVRFVKSTQTGLKQDQAELIGVTSWGDLAGCGSGAPGVYSSVLDHMDFIKKYTSVYYTVNGKVQQ